MQKTQVLFLNHVTPSNSAIAEANFRSFQRAGNDILGIHDDDVQGLPGSVPVSVRGRIPRGSKHRGADTVWLNYALENQSRLVHERYMFCEYDSYCECNIDSYLSGKPEMDVSSPHLVTRENDPGWGWFNNINLDCDPAGFRPTCFLVFTREALLLVANKYLEVWDKIKNSNSEARLGSVCSLLGLKVGVLDDISRNVCWGPRKFRRNAKMYHPVKTSVFESLLVPTEVHQPFFGSWDLGREDGHRLGTLNLNPDGTISGYNNYNESYWSSDGTSITIYNMICGVTTVFPLVKTDGSRCQGDFFDGNIKGEGLVAKNHHWISRLEAHPKLPRTSHTIVSHGETRHSAVRTSVRQERQVQEQAEGVRRLIRVQTPE